MTVVKSYMKLNPQDVDYTKFFKKQPTREQIRHLHNSSSGFPFGMMGSLILIGDIWAHEFETELTPEVKKLLKKLK